MSAAGMEASGDFGVPAKTGIYNVRAGYVLFILCDLGLRYALLSAPPPMSRPARRS